MKVFKFGGASIQQPENIKNVGSILKNYANDSVLIVISAMGKTTNALEEVVAAYYNGDTALALDRFQTIKENHLKTSRALLQQQLPTTESLLLDVFTEVEWLLHDRPVQTYDYYYDQIVCAGELMSSLIVAQYLKETGILNTWIDVRDILRTDNAFRHANVDLEYFNNAVAAEIVPALKDGFVITQGFIGATDQNESTTLGREGSDYTAALFASALNAESVTIWKDVPGFMSADPKFFPEASFIPTLSYKEVIELSFYGAQVVHPKTIQPLREKNIPLYIKSFADPHEAGTLVHHQHNNGLPPMLVKKTDQTLIEFTSKDYSFIQEDTIQKIYSLLEQYHLPVNLIQVAAVSVSVCTNFRKDIEQLLTEALSPYGNIQTTHHLTLFTIRHYNGTLIKKYIEDDKIILLQKTNQTYQALTQ